MSCAGFPNPECFWRSTKHAGTVYGPKLYFDVWFQHTSSSYAREKWGKTGMPFVLLTNFLDLPLLWNLKFQCPLNAANFPVPLYQVNLHTRVVVAL